MTEVSTQKKVNDSFKKYLEKINIDNPPNLIRNVWQVKLSGNIDRSSPIIQLHRTGTCQVAPSRFFEGGARLVRLAKFAEEVPNFD